jgi:hypothetical protein
MPEKGTVQGAIVDINGTHFGCHCRSVLLLGRHARFGLGNSVANFGNASLDDKIRELKRRSLKASLFNNCRVYARVYRMARCKRN